MIGIKTLTIGYTRDITLAEEIAREAGANELVIRTCPEGDTLNLSKSDQAMWIEKGWRLEGHVACKTLIEELPHEPEDRYQQKNKRQRQALGGYSEGGRLTASMQV